MYKLDWIEFDENDESTYPPLDEPLLLCYNTTSYAWEAETIGWGYLRQRKGEYYWSVLDNTLSTLGSTLWIGRLNLERYYPYERFGRHIGYVKRWAKPMVYIPHEEEVLDNEKVY